MENNELVKLSYPQNIVGQKTCVDTKYTRVVEQQPTTAIIFHLRGKKAVFKNCNNLQEFLNKVQDYVTLEKKYKTLQEENKILKEKGSPEILSVLEECYPYIKRERDYALYEHGDKELTSSKFESLDSLLNRLNKLLEKV